MHTTLAWRYRALTSGVALAMVVGLLWPVTASGQAASRVGGWFLFGANMPWLNWNSDFGGGPSGGGVSGNVAALDAKLQAARNAGMRNIRWWVFEGGSPQIQRDSSGTPTGLNPNVYTDLDAALAEAARFDISYNFVLFGSTNDNAETHQWWENTTKRQALVRVLTPLFQRYGSNSRVHTWEIVNEPEWQTRNGLTTTAGMLATSDALANAIHDNSRALVTVGQAQMQDMATWKGHPLDYHSPHYYDNFGTGFNDPFVTPANSASPDGKAVVIGEFQASTGVTPNAQARWQALYSGGYAGGWNWSIGPENTGDKIATDFNAAAAFGSGKSDLGPRGTSSPVVDRPTPTATAVPTPRAGGSAEIITPGTLTWDMRVLLGSTSLGRGTSLQVRDQVTASQAAKALVDLEIYDPNWSRVYQNSWENQSFSAGRTRTFGITWSIPHTATPGKYTIMVGVFSPHWGSTYSFDNNAATFDVQ